MKIADPINGLRSIPRPRLAAIAAILGLVAVVFLLGPIGCSYFDHSPD